MNGRLIVGTDNVLAAEIYDQINPANDLSGAAVSVTLRDELGNEVAGKTWPLAMTWVSGTTTALFRATLPAGLSLTVGDVYKATVIANNGLGQVRTWELYLPAEEG